MVENDHFLAVVHDATFLHAVLPYVIGQAHRYGEPLSLMCLAVDRLNGIRDLLGPEQADRAVRHVGLQIARRLRSSDIVARIEDDRIIVVLPRASVHDTWCIAEILCGNIKESTTFLPDLPSLTVSIGVAEYPGCASTVYALLDAADHALSMAQKQGRNRAIAAELLNEPALVTMAKCVG